jgi:hypothetical protein
MYVCQPQLAIKVRSILNACRKRCGEQHSLPGSLRTLSTRATITGALKVFCGVNGRTSAQTRGNPDGVWKHDMFNAPAGRRGGAGAGAGSSAKIIINNLHPDYIKDNDLKVEIEAGHGDLLPGISYYSF